MNAANFAAMSDPQHNPQFARRWVPPPLRRERRPGQGAALEFIYDNGNNSATDDSQERPHAQAERAYVSRF
jgi:hypothetical protein